MQILLLRHGIAADHAPSGRDADRALTGEGARKLRVVLGHAHASGVAPTLILSSPYRRARETAEIAASVCGYKEQILLSEALEPGGSPAEVWEEIRIHRDESQILLAGHEPLFSSLTAYLLNSPTLAVDFKKGALVRLDTHSFNTAPHCILRWMLTPGILLTKSP